MYAVVGVEARKAIATLKYGFRAVYLTAILSLFNSYCVGVKPYAKGG